MTEDGFKTICSRICFGKNKKLLFIFAALGFILVALSALMPLGESTDKENKTEQQQISSYCTEQEQRLESILSAIEGVGRVQVMLTLENGIEYRYAADEKQTGDSVYTYAEGTNPSKVQQSEKTEQSYILIGSSGEKKPLVVTELSPKVKGVVVVCDGGANPVTVKRVTDAVTTALGINSLQVCVAKATK